MLKYIFALIFIIAASTANSQQLQFNENYSPDTPIQQYFQEAYPNYNKSIIYVFYNNPGCYGCPETIAMLEQIYNSYYKDKYSFFIINYLEDDQYNFIETYNLSKPLTVVLVKVDDGAVFGFEKLDGLPEQISDPVSFSDSFRFRVNSFLGNGD